MDTRSSLIMRQPLVATSMAAFAILGMGAALLLGLFSAAQPPTGLIFGAGGILSGIVLLAYAFPVYIRHNTKICLTSIPLFLLAAVLPPVLAGCWTFLAVLAAERLVQGRRGTAIADIVTNASRWSLLTFAASAVAQLPLGGHTGMTPAVMLVAAGVLLWVGDLATLPIVLIPVSGEHPARIIASTVKEGGLAEASQYAIAVMGIALAHGQLWSLPLTVVPAALVYLAFRKEVDPDTFQLLATMADTIDLRDGYAVGHSQRVAALVEGTLHELGMFGQEARQITAAARVHNMGRATLPDHLLIKSGALTPEEQQAIAAVPDRTVEMLQAYPDLSRALEMVQHCHERWDGSGYPAGLAGTAIPFGARVIAVADAYDAMTSDRPYRRALTPDQAGQILRDGRGRQWDPTIVEALLRSIADEVAPVSEPARAALPAAVAVPNAQRAIS